MNRVIQAQLIRLLCRRTMTAAVMGSAVFAVIAAVTVFAAVKTGGSGLAGRPVTLGTLAGAGGATEEFATAASFVGFFVFVIFIALRSADLTGGTFRALLLRDPKRLRVLAGQVAGTLIVAAVVVGIAEAFTFGASIPMAAVRGVPVSAWFSASALAHAVKAYATVLSGVVGWAVLGTTLAVVFQSAPLALGVGFFWAAPFEHLVANAWTGANNWFPGLVLQALIAGGTDQLTLARSVVTALIYTGLAAAAALYLTVRRDVTG